MKKFNPLHFVFFAVLFLAACGGDDGDAASTLSGLEGDWTAISFRTTVVSTFKPDGFEETTSNFSAEGSNMNYDLNLNDGAFTTSGGYTVSISGESAGMTIPDQESDYSNVSGSGEYTLDGNKITVSGSFFELEIDGVMMTDMADMPSEATFNIDGDELTLTQDQTSDFSQPGLSSSTQVTSTSVWKRK